MKTLTIKKENGSSFEIKRSPVDEVGINQRADFFNKRSVKKEAKLSFLYMALSMCDLTTLEGADTVGKVLQLCHQARFPFSMPSLPDIPSVAAVCVYPSMVSTAKAALRGSKIQIASVSTAFPSGQAPLEIKLADTLFAITSGATEIDMVINRGAFLSGDYQKVYDEIYEIKKICKDVHLKVILETGELGSFDKVRTASEIAMEAGADFIKTSTGKINPAATMPVTLVMFYAVLDFYQRTGKIIGVKPAGGIRTSKQALQYLCMLNEVLGPLWMTPLKFRFGASALVNDLLKQILKEISGHYYYDKIFSLD